MLAVKVRNPVNPIGRCENGTERYIEIRRNEDAKSKKKIP